MRGDYRASEVDEKVRALFDYATKLTRVPWDMEPGDVQELRTRGWNDQQILDATQVISYFNYINRIAHGLHVDLEDWMPAESEALGPLVD